MTEPSIELSSAGEQRKKSILAMAKAQASRRRRRKRAAQTFAAAIIFALLIPALLLRFHRRPDQQVKVVPTVPAHANRQVAISSSKSRVVVVRIETDPQIIERLAIPSPPPQWKKIGDDELLRDLASAHRPAGLAYIDGKPMLLFRSPAHSTGG